MNLSRRAVGRGRAIVRGHAFHIYMRSTVLVTRLVVPPRQLAAPARRLQRVRGLGIRGAAPSALEELTVGWKSDSWSVPAFVAPLRAGRRVARLVKRPHPVQGVIQFTTPTPPRGRRVVQVTAGAPLRDKTCCWRVLQRRRGILAQHGWKTGRLVWY